MSAGGSSFFGAVGSLVRQRGRGVPPWRKTVYGKADSGLYATLASAAHGALQVRLRPNPADPGAPPTVEVEWGRYNGQGPTAGPIRLYSGPPPKEP